MVRKNSQTLLNERVAASLPRKTNKHATDVLLPEELPVTHPLFHFYVQEATGTSDLVLLEQVNKVWMDFSCKKGMHANVLRRTAPKLAKNQRKIKVRGGNC